MHGRVPSSIYTERDEMSETKGETKRNGEAVCVCETLVYLYTHNNLIFIHAIYELY